MRAEDTQEETQQESGKDSLVSHRLWSCNRPSALHRAAARAGRGGIVNLFPASCAVNHRHVSHPPGTEKLAREMRRRQWKTIRRSRIFELRKSPGWDKEAAWDFPLYALTGICLYEYIKIVESVFEIIAEPNRRAILNLLVASEQSVGEIERQLRMPQPTVSKHLRVLREAGFVESNVDAQRRLYRVKPEPLQEVDAWLAPFRRFWSVHLDALERHLDRMGTDRDKPTSMKKKRSRTRSTR
jgi:DNA-binding transcriptional ArsR family regulator